MGQLVVLGSHSILDVKKQLVIRGEIGGPIGVSSKGNEAAPQCCD